ncbi:MAG: hypothetical protein ACJ8R9_08795 [Steroidobacteraceae bacterium]
MYKYLIAFVLITPLIGVWMVEGGEYAGSVDVQGYPNGATMAYGLYVVAVVCIAMLCARAGRRPIELQPPSREADALFRRFSAKLLLVEIVFMLLFLFGFGAINTWLGGIGKGEFRVGLGDFGAFPNAMSKFVIPALLAYCTLLYRRSSRSGALKLRLSITFFIAFVTGASWGFKSTAIASVAPALLLLYWRVRPLQLVVLAAAFVGSLMLFFWIFDADLGTVTDAQAFLLRRVTVLQGDVAWYIWGLHSSGASFPSYWPTLLAAMGDKVLSALGISRSDYYEWMLYHYDWMITYLAGASLEQIAEGGHSIVAQPFAEGLIAGGLGGLVLFTVIAGVLTGRMYTFLDTSMRKGHDLSAAFGATYFCYYLLPWLSAGAIVQLFHISLLVSFGSTWAMLTLMRRRWTFGSPLPVAAPPPSPSPPATA